jgi:hypothetical protein
MIYLLYMSALPLQGNQLAQLNRVVHRGVREKDGRAIRRHFGAPAGLVDASRPKAQACPEGPAPGPRASMRRRSRDHPRQQAKDTHVAFTSRKAEDQMISLTCEQSGDRESWPICDACWDPAALPVLTEGTLLCQRCAELLENGDEKLLRFLEQSDSHRQP